MRRSLVGLTAFLAMTGTFVVLPVSAAPSPQPEAVETSVDTVELGSVDAPAAAADVAPAEDVQPDVVGTVPADAPQEAEPVAASDPVLTLSRTDVDQFSAVGVTWAVDADVSDVKVRLRTAVDGGWSDWTDLQADDAEQTPTRATGSDDVRDGTAPYWTGPSTGVEVQLTAASGEQPRDVELDLIDPGHGDADATAGDVAAVQDEAHAASTRPTILSRADWGADESIRFWDPEYAPTIKAATIHHTADSNGYTAAQVPALLRSIYTYHTQSRGWGDIGYNVIVDKFGRAWEGRYGGLTSTVIGAHAGGFNTGTFGVSMLGNYAVVDTPGVMLDTVAAVIAWKLGLYGVDPNGATQLTSGGGGTAKYAAGQVVNLPTIFAHRDVGNTTCPGDYAYNRMGQIRALVTAKMPPIPGSPVGNLEQFSISGSKVTATGWTFDPDTPGATVPVDLLIDGVPAVEWQANGSRPDVGNAYPAAGANHGFSATHQLPLGEHSVCAVALNLGPTGAHNWLACRSVTVRSLDPVVNPFGNVEGIQLNGRTLSTQGWTIDPDAQTSALDVHVYVNGGWGGAVVANGSRPDVAAVYPAAGANHGFSWSLQVNAPGDYKVCVFAINKNAGTTNPQLGCGTVTVAPELWNPLGHADSGTLDVRAASLTGWAVDLDAPTTPSAVQVVVDGSLAKTITADQSRPDVAAAFPGVGNGHGYSTSLNLPPGFHRVCTYAVNVGPGSGNSALGCHGMSVAPASWNPFGNLDVVQRVGGSVTVSGWALDPDSIDRPIDVHLYVDGRGAAAVTADRSRPDVGAAFPGAGAAHGYTASLALPPGQQTVCAYAINVGYGTHNPLLTCRTLPG